jgi:hypothetical protein
MHLIEARAATGRDLSPKWDGCDEWDASTFALNLHWAMKYYNVEKSAKELKPAVIKWMGLNGFSTEQINIYKKGADWRSNTSVGGFASCLLKGMQPQRDDFNRGADTSVWLRNKILEILDDCTADQPTDADPVIQAAAGVAPNIQDRLKDVSLEMASKLEETIEEWSDSTETFNHKAFNVHSYLKGKSAKSNHARLIKLQYAPMLAEFEELAGPSLTKPTDVDVNQSVEPIDISDPGVTQKDMHDQLKEGYSNRSKKNIASMLYFLRDISSACDLIIQEEKEQRELRSKKNIPKDKLVEKLIFLKTDLKLNLVSIDPVYIVGASILWCFDTQTKKLFRYVADTTTGPLSVKGTSLTGFDPAKSIGKTVHKPADHLAVFKIGSNAALDKFFDALTTVEIKANGRVNANQLILKYQ